MKLLSWNIQHGGGNRAAGVVNAIAAHSPDIVILTEFRTKPGAPIRLALRELGWRHCESTEPVGADNGICALSRTPLRRSGASFAPPENAVRWLDLEIPEFGFAIAALHILTSTPGLNERPGAAKTRFWDAVLDAAENRIQQPFLFVGDFNTGLPYLDEVGNTFVCAEHFARLSELGWTDVWRHCHDDKISIFVRELAEFGARWHGCSWSTHTLLGGNPATKRVKAIHMSDPSTWTWLEPEPAEWRPVAAERDGRVTVTFYTHSALGGERVIRHVDVYSPGTYRFDDEETVIAEGGMGFVF